MFISISSMKKVDHDGRLEIWYNWLPQEHASCSVYQITHHGLESSSRASINSFSTNWRLDFDISSSNEIDLSNSVDILINQEWDEREVKVNVIMLEYEEETRSYFTPNLVVLKLIRQRLWGKFSYFIVKAIERSLFLYNYKVTTSELNTHVRNIDL